MLNPSKKSLSLKRTGDVSFCGLYELKPDFYVRYQTDMFGIRPTTATNPDIVPRVPSSIFL